MASEADPSLLIDGEPPFVDPVMFENITESTIANAALRTRGSNGSSGLDADSWRRILVSKNFGTADHSLRSALANFARKISTTETEVLVSNGTTYTNLEAYTACRLIPLDKNPGVKAHANGRNKCQQLPTLLGAIGQQCCIRLHGPKSLTGFKLYTTSANKCQHCCGSMQTDVTSHNIVGPNNVGCC